jgi:glycosyltransferase involved in cell wall biosynthesis
VVVAHHVEAALACLLVGASFVYVAHTSLRDELPSYFPATPASMLRRAGSGVDRRACRGASRALAVAPALAARLRVDTQVDVHALTLPWSIPTPISERERGLARAQLGFDAADRVLLYAGNLDAYQGLDGLAASVRQLVVGRGKLFLLVATASDPATCSALRAPGLPVRFAPLANEDDRRLVHAAADLVVVPRAVPGGVPIKLLDALARGTKVVTTQRAAAGLNLGDACVVVADDDPRVFAEACASLLGSAPNGLGHAARAYVESAHVPAEFVAQFVDLGLSAHSF